MANITPSATNFNPSDPILAEHAAEIRRLGKRVKEDVIEIGRHLVEARNYARGAFLKWLDVEFGWSDQTAYHFIHLYQAHQEPGFQKFWNADLPLSSLYALAAPSTPKDARQEVARQIESGEMPDVANVQKAIAGVKKGKKNKTTKTASPGTKAEASNNSATDVAMSAEQRKAHYAASETNPPITDTNAAVSTLDDPVAVAAAAVNALSPAELQHFLDLLSSEHRRAFEQLLAERRQPVIDLVQPEPRQASDDLPIPDFLRRDRENNPQAATEINAAEIVDKPGSEDRNQHDRENAPADNAAIEEPDDFEEEDPEPEPRPKRQIKYIEHERSLANAIDIAFEGLSALADECREVVDSVSDCEGLQQTQRSQTFEQSAEDLENVEAPDIADAIQTMPIKYALPKRRYLSRAARAEDVCTILQVCVTALN